MKIIIISDTHRQHRTLDQLLERVGQIDLLIHLGDTEGGEHYIKAAADCPSHIIRGNNDFFSDLKREEEFNIGKYRVFITHGHCYGVIMGNQQLKEEARARHADIVMYGHTHRPELVIEDDLTTLNPGSLSYPRQEGRKCSYILMEIDREGEAHYTINYL